MKRLSAPLKLVAIACLLLGMTPAGATTTQPAAGEPTVEVSNPIGSYWQDHQDELGEPVTNYVKYDNGAAEQVFSKAVVTFGRYGGIQVIPGDLGTAFIEAGGTMKFGNAESEPFSHSFCGQAITTHNGRTRWLIILDSKTQPGTYINLRSDAALTWQAEREATGACFPRDAHLQVGTSRTIANIGDAEEKMEAARQDAVAHGIIAPEPDVDSRPYWATYNSIAQDFGNNVSAIYTLGQPAAIVVNTDALGLYMESPAKYGLIATSNEYPVNEATSDVRIQAIFSETQPLSCLMATRWGVLQRGATLMSSPGDFGIDETFYTRGLTSEGGDACSMRTYRQNQVLPQH